MPYIAKAFNGSDGGDSRTKSTISVWVKRAKLGQLQSLWSWGENNSSDAYLRFNANDTLRFHSDGAGSPIDTARVFRDTHAWYHIVCTLDGSNGTEALRRRIWINGVELVHGVSTSAFSSAVMGHNSVQDLYVGEVARQQQSGTNAEPFIGSMSHFHYCDGFAYTAADFGSFDSSSGIWKISTAPDVSYGTHGIFLKMEDSSNMDLDSSPNASSQLSTTGTILSILDNPSNNFATFNNLYNHTRITFSDCNTTGSEAGNNWGSSWSSLGAMAGKWYAEFKFSWTSSGEAYVGIGTNIHIFGTASAAGGNYWAFQRDGYDYVGYSKESWGLYSNGNGENTGGTGWTGHSGAYNTGTPIIGVAFDADDKKLYLSKDGVWADGSGSWGSSTFDAAVGAVSTSAADGDIWFFGASPQEGSCKANFGNGYFGTDAVASGNADSGGVGSFEYAPPTGFRALCTKNLASYGG